MTASAFDKVCELIRAHQRFLLTGHVRPDGDCLGAECALFHLLRSMGKQVAIVNPDPLSDRYRFLAGHAPFGAWDPKKARGGTEPFEVACVLDVAVLERTGPLAAQIRADGAKTCVFDHHQPGTAQQWDVEWIDSTAPATGVLVYRLAQKLQITLPKQALEGVFISLTTDTGWFKYSNTTAECFQIAADLARAGVQPSDVFGKLFQTYPPEYPLGVGAALRAVRYEANGRLAVCPMRPELFASVGAELQDTDEVLDLLRAVGDVEAVLLFRVPTNHRVKVSARSKGKIDVNQLLRPFGGGGHTRAAGADIEGAFDATVERVVQAAIRALDGAPPAKEHA